MHFHDRNFLYFDSNFTEVCSWQKTALVQVMACRQTGDKPLPEPMLIRLNDAYIWRFYHWDNQATHYGIMQNVILRWKNALQTRYHPWCLASRPSNEAWLSWVDTGSGNGLSSFRYKALPIIFTSAALCQLGHKEETFCIRTTHKFKHIFSISLPFYKWISKIMIKINRHKQPDIGTTSRFVVSTGFIRIVSVDKSSQQIQIPPEWNIVLVCIDQQYLHCLYLNSAMYFSD